MGCVSLLDEARAAGLTLRADGDKLIIRGPRSAEPVARRLIDRKAEVLAALTDSHEPQPLAPRLPGRQPDLYEVDGRLLTFVERAAHFRDGWKATGYPPGIQPAGEQAPATIAPAEPEPRFEYAGCRRIEMSPHGDRPASRDNIDGSSEEKGVLAAQDQQEEGRR